MKQYYVSPCDDENGRTWDVVRRANKSNGNVVQQGIATRAEARKIAQKLNNPDETTWTSPNGVTHTILRGKCITCGRNHEV